MKSRILTLLLALVLALGAAVAARASGDPPSGTVVGITEHTVFPATALTGLASDQTTPQYVGGFDVWNTRYYHAGELFVFADFGATGFLTVTAQYSPDAENWTDGATFADDGTAIASVVHLSEAGAHAGYVPLRLAGLYTRVHIVHTTGITDTTRIVTPTVTLVLRNNGGSP
jgi:hypothetical protein